jgi:hypothetical protein
MQALWRTQNGTNRPRAADKQSGHGGGKQKDSKNVAQYRLPNDPKLTHGHLRVAQDGNLDFQFS